MATVAALRVHIAELVIATDPADADESIADSISERAEAKGLAVVGREVVGDVEELIRAKLEAFIADPNVDVVIATGVAESTAAANALRPLVTQPVPGFTDLFRWLAFQEIGASAMLSNAEAAQCTSTFVFVLPAVKGAVVEAMNKLILPQLDPATMPKNLVQQIPRLAPLVELARAAAPRIPEPPKAEAVPHKIESERTESGPGISARMPAGRAEAKSKTGPHVIRKEPAPDVTRQIDRSELERTIRKSESNDAVTRPAIDIRTLLPRLPPGADEDTDEGDEVGDTTDITGAAPPQPLARVKLVQPVKNRKPPTIQIPALPKPAAKSTDEDTDEHVPVTKPAETVAEKRPAKPTEKPTEKPKDRVPPALQKKTPPAVSVVSLADLAKSADDLDTGQVLKLPAKAAKPATRPTPTPTPAPARPAPTASTPPPSAASGATPRPARIPTSDIAELDADLVSEELPTTRAAAIKPADVQADAAQTGAAADDDEVATIHAKKAAPDADAAATEAPVVVEKRVRPKTEPPPLPKKRAPTEPPVLKVPDKKQPESRAARTPTEPPPPRDSLNDLPRGKFVYPVSTGSTGKTIAKWLVAALFAAGAGVAFVHFFLAKPEHSKVAIADAAAERVVEAPIDATAVAEVEADAAIPEIVIDVSDTGSGSATPTGSGHGSAAAHPAHPTHPTGTGTHVPTTAHAGSGAGSGTGSAAGAGSAAVATAGSASPPEDPTCDEVSCVLEKYARACCARYKPADSGFKPAFPGQTEALDKVAVKEGIEGVKPRVIACGEKFSAKGTVKIAMTVGPDGNVKDASVADSPTPELGSCVAQALRAATFLKTAKGGSFVYPFAF
jgi:molybdenum cofactor biosynthesis protein B